MSAKNQKAILQAQHAALHKHTPDPVVHRVNDANKSLPYDVPGGGNQPYTGLVRNKAQGGLPSGKNSGKAQLPQTGKPGAPFTSSDKKGKA